MEAHFFDASCKALDLSSVNADRLIDCMRAALLLSAYSYTSGRYHEVRVRFHQARASLTTGLGLVRFSCPLDLVEWPASDQILRLFT